MKLHGGGFMTTIATIEINGEKHKVLPKDYQLDPVRDFVDHVDFLRISKNTVVTVKFRLTLKMKKTARASKKVVCLISFVTRLRLTVLRIQFRILSPLICYHLILVIQSTSPALPCRKALSRPLQIVTLRFAPSPHLPDEI